MCHDGHKKPYITVTPLAAVCLAHTGEGSPAPHVSTLNYCPGESLGLSPSPYSIFSNCKVHSPWKAWKCIGQWAVAIPCVH